LIVSALALSDARLVVPGGRFIPPGSRTQRAIPKLVPAKAGTALEAATHRNSNAPGICENLITTLQTLTYITIKTVRKTVG